MSLLEDYQPYLEDHHKELRKVRAKELPLVGNASATLSDLLDEALSWPGTDPYENENGTRGAPFGPNLLDMPGF